MPEENKMLEILDGLGPILKTVAIKYAGEIIKSEIKAQFKAGEDIDMEWCNNYKKNAGIYLFEIKFNTIDLNVSKEEMNVYLKQQWNLSKRGSTPNIIEGKVKHHNIKNDTWIPFYIGKSKDINDRVVQHIRFSRKTKDTYALRLNELVEGIFKEADYRVRIADLNSYSGDRYWIVERIESIMRNEINPICGKQ
ncbi:MAG: hypothetical protein ACRCX2_32145 [Paraclostridium sp.]